MGQVYSNKYEELERLGQGGMGVVYKVRHTTLGMICAMKVLPLHLMDNPDLVERFYREARVMAQLTHTNIVRVIDIDRDERCGWYYFVMEYIQGRVLKKYLKERGPLPLAEVLEIACQVARALVYAHRQTPPVIHRDIKPENIMIEEPSQRVVVLDFGIAKRLEAGSQFTVAGTPKYSAPEQLLGKPITGSVDVYSLGLVLYEMITGKQFFAGLDNNAVFAQALNGQTEFQVEPQAAVPAPLTAIINRAIARTPEKRYPTMLDFIKELEAYRRMMNETPTELITPAPESYSTIKVEKPPPSFASEAKMAAPQEQTKPSPSFRSERLSAQTNSQPQKDFFAHNTNTQLFTMEGKLDRAQFDTDAFRTLVATTAESNSLGDTKIAVFHLFISMTRGPYLKGVTRYLTKRTGSDLDAKLKVLRALARQAYHRPIVEERLIVRDLYRVDLEKGMLQLLQSAAQLAQQGEIRESHLLAALLGSAPVELLPVLQESGFTLTNLQQYRKDNP